MLQSIHRVLHAYYRVPGRPVPRCIRKRVTPWFEKRLDTQARVYAQSIRVLPGGIRRRMASKVPVRALRGAHARAGRDLRSGVTNPLPKEVGMTLCAALRFRLTGRAGTGPEPSRRLSEPTGPRSASAFRIAFLSAEVTERRCEANPRRRVAHLAHRDATIAAAGGAPRVVGPSIPRQIAQRTARGDRRRGAGMAPPATTGTRPPPVGE